MHPTLEKIISAPFVPTVYPSLSINALRSFIRILHDEGYTALETLGRPLDQALELARRLNDTPERELIQVGLGTVLMEDDALQAIEVNPDFLVSPAFSRKVLRVAVDSGIPYIPGVCSFQDVQNALEAFSEENERLHVLKLCPVEGLSQSYVQMLTGCYPGIVYCPTGEITVENYSYWKRTPGISAPMGAMLVPREMLEQGDSEAVRERLRELKSMAEPFEVIPDKVLTQADMQPTNLTIR